MLRKSITIAGIALAIAGCKRTTSAPVSRASAVVPVTLAATRVQPVQRYVEAVGTLWGDEDVTISNKVPGKVVAIHKDVGDRVMAGEPLAQLLKNDYELDRRQREYALHQVLSKLGLKELPPADFDVNQLPAVRRAALQTENARSKFNRGKQLQEQKPPLISDQDFADLKTALDVAEANLQAEVLTARELAAESRTRAAELDVASLALADTTVRAPRSHYPGPPPTGGLSAESEASHDGSARTFSVVARMASVGELEKAITPMFRLVADDPLKLRVNVPERHTAEVKIDQKVLVRIEAFDRDFEGRISRINPQVDPVNRTFQVEVLVTNTEHLLKPGSFASARILTRRDERVVFVPIESITAFAGANRVFTIEDGKALEHAIDIGQRDGDWLEAVSGVTGGQQVVIEGASKLATGVPVEMKQAAATRAAN
ncbi:MAG: efflux RND transporter periplasmic adaptor subunit [Tepidisphaerales bacterium]